mmetsp:Transcript_16603/g.37307  ORF Transcript_16603/g.37307 Transcript_16603/m.37307 type:complete len:391 (+) Transcript_16603:131-1303(+)
MGNLSCCKQAVPCKSPVVEDYVEFASVHAGEVTINGVNKNITGFKLSASGDNKDTDASASTVEESQGGETQTEVGVQMMLENVPKTVLFGGGKDCTARLWDLEHGESIIGFKGHSRAVTCVAIEWDGLHLITGSADHSLKVWNRATGDIIKELQGHRGGITCVAVNWQRSRALSGSSDCSVCLWDMTNGNCIQELKGHLGSISCLDVEWDQSQVLTGSYDCSLRMWVSSNYGYKQVSKITFDCVQCVDVDWAHMLALSASFNTLRLWDLSKGVSTLDLRGHINTVTCVRAEWESRKAVSASTDRTLRVWNLATGEALLELSSHHGTITNLEVSWPVQRCLSASKDGTLRLWDLESGECLEVFVVSSKSQVQCFAVDWSKLRHLMRRVDSV